MVYNTSELDPLVAEYEKRARVLEDLLDDYISKKRRSAKLKIKKVRQDQGGAVGGFRLG